MWRIFQPIRNMLDFVENHIPSQVLTFLSMVSSVVTIVSVAIGCLTSFTQMEPWGWLVFLYNRPHILLVICIITIIILLLTAYHYYIDGRKRLELFTSEYHAATHNYRDLEYQLKISYDERVLDSKTVVQSVQRYCQMVTDSICTQLHQVTKHNISGCIKLVNPGASENGGEPAAIGDQTVSDFVRSATTEEERRQINPNKKVLIRDNTDYLEIMDPNNVRVQFYQSNLVAYAKQLKDDDHEYANSTSNWQEKYKCTAVAPIQIDGKFKPNGKEGTSYVIGFLCVDAKEVNALPMKQKTPIMAMLKAYSDLLYCVLDMYNYYLDSVSDREYIIKLVEKVHLKGIGSVVVEENVSN